MGKAILWVVAVLILGGVISAVIPKAPPSVETATDKHEESPSPSAIEAAKSAIKAEPKVKDFIYQPGQAVEWQIGVLDDGTSRVGYANYICELLAEKGVSEDRTQVRVVDIAKVAAGTNFRSASLGHVACADRRVITP